ncbi:MAG: hypothetical protein R3F19_12110 [Verrucomicrobiales bacterium]
MPEPELNDMKKGDRVRFVTEVVLKEENFTKSENSVQGPELYDLVEKKFGDIDVPKTSFASFLNRISSEPASKINCLGRKQGYYLAEALPDLQEESIPDPQEDDKVKKRVEKEKLLYPVLISWMLMQGFRAADVSKIKSMGRWGNPDITGIAVEEHFGLHSLDICTIEAKTSITDWQMWIFEAISHRRFANRSYFAFAHPIEARNKIPPEMRYYAELFKIGVLVIALENDVFEKLGNGEITESLKPEDVEIIEVYSAPYSQVPPKYQKGFCERSLEISSTKQLWLWGESPPDAG